MFTNNWFEMTAKSNFEEYVKPLSGRFLEIGCYEGRATKWLLENTSADVEVLDTFEGSAEHFAEQKKNLFRRFTDNTKGYEKRLTVHRGMSADVLKTLKGTFDFIYIDGSHHAQDILTDGVLSFGLLKVGGIMIFDDYGWSDGTATSPKTAIDIFIRIFSDPIHVLNINNQAVIKRVI